MLAKVGRSISFVLIALPEQFLHALAVLYTDSRHLNIMLSICVRLNTDKVKIDSKSMGSIYYRYFLARGLRLGLCADVWHVETPKRHTRGYRYRD
jgi:hypothetical protein